MAVGKLDPIKLQSLVGESMGSIVNHADSTPRLNSSCPHLVLLGGVLIPCLIDAGSMVSTFKQKVVFVNIFNCEKGGILRGT